jgi:hypothetical protein
VADPVTWQAFGAFGMVCVVLVWVIVDQRATIREQKDELRADRKQIIDEVVPLATRMLDALKDAGEIVKAAAKGQTG